VNRKQQHGWKTPLCAAVLCAVVCAPQVALSQERQLSGEEQQEMARLLLGDEIRSGKLTLRQGADYVKCTQEAYARDFFNSPSGKQYLKALRTVAGGEQASAQEQAKARAQLDGLQPELRKYQDEAETLCAKKTGVSVPKGKVFGQQP
jgi:hypothetical protein